MFHPSFTIKAIGWTMLLAVGDLLGQRDPSFVVLATLVCVLGCALAATLLGRKRLARANRGLAAEAGSLRRSRAQLMEAIEAFPEGFVLYDAEGRFVLSNDRYRAMYAASADL